MNESLTLTAIFRQRGACGNASHGSAGIAGADLTTPLAEATRRADVWITERSEKTEQQGKRVAEFAHKREENTVLPGTS